jgi:heme A synthase
VSVGLELLILGLGLVFYARGRTRRRPLRPIRLAVVLVPLVGGYVASLAGPPPTSIPMLGMSVVVLLLGAGALAAWADRAATPAELAAMHPPR